MSTQKHTLRWILGATLVAMTLALGLGSAQAASGTKAFDRGMKKVFRPYVVIAKALAADTTQGVAHAAKRIIRMTRALKPASVRGEHASHYAKLPAALKRAATALAKAKNITAARGAFNMLSRPMVMWATMSKPQGINILYCSMAKGSWLQTSKTVANPYYGRKMSTCGEFVKH